VVAGLKVMPETGNKEANYALFEKLTRRAAAAGADFIVTPEGYLDGYLGSPKMAPGMTHEKLYAAADPIDGPVLKKVAALAKELKVYIMFGFSEKSGDKVFNTVALFAPDGSLAGHYSKTHTVPGGELYDLGHELKVFDTKLGRMGVLICFDRQPPENARTLALRGAQFIVVPAFGMTSNVMDEDILLRARAYENGIYIIYSSPRNAFVADPAGNIISQIRSDENELMFAKVTLNDRIHDRNAFQVRHTELYGRLVEPAGK
jgi:predicted amidohydrolase